MSNEHNGYNKYDWENDLSTEVDFWNWVFIESFEKQGGILNNDDKSNKAFINRNIIPTVNMFVKTKDDSMLDVGSGPISIVGECFNGQFMPNIVCTDALADLYNELLDKHKIETQYRPVKIDFCDEAEVKMVLQDKKFNIAHTNNALDHTYAPDKAIRNMLLCLDKQGVFIMKVIMNEGANEKYRGLHKWDFGIGDSGVLISNQDKSVTIYLQDIIDGLGSSDKFNVCHVFSTDFIWRQEIRTTRTLYCTVFKNYDDKEVDKYYNKMQKLAFDETEKFCEEAQKRLWEIRDKMRKAQARLNELGEKIPE